MTLSDITDFLKQRRSVIVKNLEPVDVPQNHIDDMIACGLRVPDHGVLGPWHIKVIDREAGAWLGTHILKPEFERQHEGVTEVMLAHEAGRLTRTNLVFAVLSTPKESQKIPVWEMQLTAGAVCQNILTAALSLGYGAQWVTEWYSYNEAMISALGGTPGHDQIAGFIYVGGKSEPPKERRRPEYDDVVSRFVPSQAL